MDITPQQRARAVVLADEVVAVVEEAGDPGGAAVDLVKPSERIVAQRRGRAADGGADQPVLDVVNVAVGAARGQVAVSVVSEAGAADGRVLVDAVRRVGAADIDLRDPGGTNDSKERTRTTDRPGASRR